MEITNQHYDAGICPVSKTIALISGKWKPVILYLIRQDINRFGLLQEKMPRISKKILTGHLRELEKHGLISREVIVSKHPQIVIYHLTGSGISLLGLTAQIFQWGNENLCQNTIPILNTLAFTARSPKFTT
ncbi:winged helix-turn-helix transcriptional regulator [Chitinophaga arvensicola]|uniref:DNA-binding transcriptional regulator, HxlR family n=1 Tax=Chitinophaga arvensicola TaxID=29529 RepID=A0A1I0RGJ2_9BACT|nr:helix-turn-helix domain-containing protein [Chitinophaga arvensicola]SEW39801.1 DNA-binding transcriptional regulator, HxlR family [Chitinophaga arvensicola]